MNLFKKYAKDIKNIVLKNKNSLNIDNISNIDSIVVESPPEQFDYDLSSNVAMVLSKINNQNPRNLAEKLRTILINNINDFAKIDIAGPGFLNFKFNKKAWVLIINSILKSKSKYGSNKIKKNIMSNLYLQIQRVQCTLVIVEALYLEMLLVIF